MNLSQQELVTPIFITKKQQRYDRDLMLGQQIHKQTRYFPLLMNLLLFLVF